VFGMHVFSSANQLTLIGQAQPRQSTTSPHSDAASAHSNAGPQGSIDDLLTESPSVTAPPQPEATSEAAQHVTREVSQETPGQWEHPSSSLGEHPEESPSLDEQLAALNCMPDSTQAEVSLSLDEQLAALEQEQLLLLNGNRPFGTPDTTLAPRGNALPTPYDELMSAPDLGTLGASDLDLSGMGVKPTPPPMTGSMVDVRDLL